MRRPLVAANWKMNLDLAGIRALIADLRQSYDKSSDVDVVLCAAFPYLFPMAKALAGTGIRMGGQNVFHEASGAYTGEVSAAMLVDTGAKYVIIGHSERRHTIGHLEDDHMINLKLKAALNAGLTPILCVGETIAERKAERTLDILTFQLRAALIGVQIENPAKFVVAYEPVWAIGTGQVATPQQAQDAHAHLRSELGGIIGSEQADAVRILYGGSVKPDSAAEIFRQTDVDGGLIGGASLKSDSFAAIITAALASKS